MRAQFVCVPAIPTPRALPAMYTAAVAAQEPDPAAAVALLASLGVSGRATGSVLLHSATPGGGRRLTAELSPGCGSSGDSPPGLQLQRVRCAMATHTLPCYTICVLPAVLCGSRESESGPDLCHIGLWVSAVCSAELHREQQQHPTLTCLICFASPCSCCVDWRHRQHSCSC